MASWPEAALPTDWELHIGLEIHCRLATRSKLFSGAPNRYGAEPNTQACIIDLGFPGVLPVPNRVALEMAIRFGLAIGAEIARVCIFERKNYFYPDLPKGYQISQYVAPIVGRGQLSITLPQGERRHIGITRAHLEEDAGKSVHEGFGEYSGIDLNRAGTPLLEIVSEPDMHSAIEAASYMRKLHTLVRYLDICDGNMQEGSFRCDTNVSVRRKGDSRLGTRTEIKNINSFRFVEQAINYEAQRQIALLEDGGSVVQETRLYDPEKNRTRPMRSKEEAQDYRYFPDPDLPPVCIEDDWVQQIKDGLPELPDAREARLRTEYGLNVHESTMLGGSRHWGDYFEACLRQLDYRPGDGFSSGLCARWILGELAGALNHHGLDIQDSPVSPVQLAGVIARIADGTISGKIGKEIFAAVWDGQGSADEIIARRGLRQISDDAALEALVAQVVREHTDQQAQYRAGDEEKRRKLIGFFVGRAMKASAGKANPQRLNELLRAYLDAS